MNLSASNYVTLKTLMTNCKCSFIVDSGADISIFKREKILPNQRIDVNKKFNINGITNKTIETIAETETCLITEGNLSIVHNFQIVSDDFPIPTDGILGRDFLVKFRCTIDYEYWLLNLNIDNHTISLPIQDNTNNAFTIPARCEVIRNVPNFFVKEDSIVLSQQVLPGVFCGNTIVSPTSKYIKFINTTGNQVVIENFKPQLDALNNYDKYIYKQTSRINNINERFHKLISQINLECSKFYKKNLINLIKKKSRYFLFTG